MESLGTDDDLLDFADEDSGAAEDSTGQRPWRVLVVDDDPNIHSVTTMLLTDFRYQSRPLELLTAHSGREAREIMKNEPDIALVLLDVVMESDDAGLQTARYIREELKNDKVRIVLRTGQPGSAPE